MVLLTIALCAGSAGADETIPKPEPGSGISETVFAADRFADGMASVNTATCLNSSVFGPTPSIVDRATLDYIRVAGFRHVRDGFAPFCYHEQAYDNFWSHVAASDRITLTAGLGVGYTTQLLQSLGQSVPRLEALEFANEWDSAKQPGDGSVKLVAEVKNGDRSLAVGRSMAFYWIVPGQSYVLDDGDRRETVVVSKSVPTSFDHVNLEAPLRFDHESGTPLKRSGDFVSDIPLWYDLYGPLVRRFLPRVTLLGPSLAHPIASSAFAKQNVSLAHRIDALDSHPYALDSENPEGADGDGFRGASHVDHPPCSYGGTSYSFEFNVVCAGKQIVGSDVDLPTWITEYSYQVVPDGATPNVHWPRAIPDDVAVDYLAASEFFAAERGVTRLFWFQIHDGTSGPQSGFCPYGLLRDATCDPNYPSMPDPKPEFLALMSLTAYFDDRNCVGACLETHGFDGRWSPSSLPLDTANAHFSDGRTAVVFWLGAPSYESHAVGACAATTSCYLHVTPRAERFQSAAIATSQSVYLTGIDDDPRDPLPEIATVRPDDGLGDVSVRKCSGKPESRPRFGCILPLRKLDVVGDTVTVDAKRELQWLVIVPRAHARSASTSR